MARGDASGRLLTLLGDGGVEGAGPPACCSAQRTALADWAEGLPWNDADGKRKVVEFFRTMRFSLDMGEQLAPLNAMEMHQFFSLSPNWQWAFDHGHTAESGGALCLRTLAQLLYFLRSDRFNPMRSQPDELAGVSGDGLLQDDDRRVLLGSFPAALANNPRKWADVSIDVSRWLDGQMPLLSGKPSKVAAMNWARRYLKQRRAYLNKRINGPDDDQGPTQVGPELPRSPEVKRQRVQLPPQ